MTDILVAHWRSPIGMLQITISDQTIVEMKKSSTKGEQKVDDSRFQPIIRQLREYFAGERQSFDFPVETRGTPFQLAVWRAITGIPYGETVSYKKVAQMIGKPAAARAVGNALNKNPVCIVVPCHRVTASDGLGGYAFGVGMKRKLLELEATSSRHV